MYNNRLKTIPAILGPTASGKTALAMKLAERFPIEIISVDSRQVYKLMNIGTAKPTREELSQVPHHLIDVVFPDEPFNAGIFVNETNKIIPAILKRGKIPLLVGGTGLYIHAMEHGLFNVEISVEVKEKVRALCQESGLEFCYNMLKQKDPLAASRYHPNDKQRILRALEVVLDTGKSIIQWQKESNQLKSQYDVKKIILYPERKFLYPRINDRVVEMIKNGLIDETKMLLEQGYGLHCNGMKTVGYVETIRYLEEHSDTDELIDEIKKNTRRYAKRQFTWFKKHGDIFLTYEDNQSFNQLLPTLETLIRKEILPN
ncbi:MAG: tRNA (adenosine(37)-N6)-dimethylallyltransferase MiaA [Calditrichia bacterium]